MKIAFLGPNGTFSEQAARCAVLSDEHKKITYVPMTTIEDVFDSVENDCADLGVVPIENSIEGAVNATVDTFIFSSNLFIQQQVSLSITQNMLVHKLYDKNSGTPIRKILSHPQALAQSRKFTNLHYPEAEIVITSSTSEAAKIISETNPSEAIHMAAIGTELSGEIYGLSILHKSIEENKNNTTYFAVIGKDNTAEPKNHCKTSIAFSTLNKPGELYRILDIFSIWDINMTKINSRPTKLNDGYLFYIDLDVQNNCADIKDALTMVKRKTSFYKNFGCYPCNTILSSIKG